MAWMPQWVECGIMNAVPRRSAIGATLPLAFESANGSLPPDSADPGCRHEGPHRGIPLIRCRRRRPASSGNGHPMRPPHGTHRGRSEGCGAIENLLRGSARRLGASQ